MFGFKLADRAYQSTALRAVDVLVCILLFGKREDIATTGLALTVVSYARRISLFRCVAVWKLQRSAKRVTCVVVRQPGLTGNAIPCVSWASGLPPGPRIQAASESRSRCLAAAVSAEKHGWRLPDAMTES